MFVYLLQNKINGKFYVGQTTRADVNKRFREHSRSETAYGTGRYKTSLARSINKYGWYNFDRFVLEVCNSQQELDELETYWIQRMNCLSPNGYNLRDGGGRGAHTEESRKKLSEAHTGKKLSLEHRAIISANNRGRKMSDRNKEAIREAHLGNPKTEDHKKKISLGKSGTKNQNAKLTWEIVREIRRLHVEEDLTFTQLGEQFGVERSAISRLIKNKTWKELVDPSHLDNSN